MPFNNESFMGRLGGKNNKRDGGPSSSGALSDFVLEQGAKRALEARGENAATLDSIATKISAMIESKQTIDMGDGKKLYPIKIDVKRSQILMSDNKYYSPHAPCFKDLFSK